MDLKPHPSSIKAGKIAAKVLTEICTRVKPGVKVFDLCTFAEKRIIELGVRPAFPCNISINDIAAHYTSPKADKTRIPDFGLVKVDIGVHVDGYIADTARTVDIDGTLEGFVMATDDALNEAITSIRPGTRLGEIGARIEKVIKEFGLRPVKELTGHSINRYSLHSGKHVPNIKTRDTSKIVAGEYYAIEPFATSGTKIIESKNVYIFANTHRNVSLNGVAEKLRVHLEKRYGPLPFASRWIGVSKKNLDVPALLKTLLHAGAIRAYPVLIEKNGRPVSQSEHTIFVSNNDAVVLTHY